MSIERKCCGTFHGTPHRSTCNKYGASKIKPTYTYEDIEAAVLAEREACAKVCETPYDNGLMMVPESPWCAAAIRARGEK